MDVYYPCLNSCKKCKDEFTCDDCYKPLFLSPNNDSCVQDCGYCYAKDKTSFEAWQCVNCKTRYPIAKYNLNGTCYDKIPLITYKDPDVFNKSHHIINNQCNLLIGCKEGCFNCSPWYSETCIKCKKGYYKEDFFNLIQPNTYHCFKERDWQGLENYRFNKTMEIWRVPKVINGEEICYNCRLREGNYRQVENNFTCGPKVKRTYISIIHYNKLSNCFFRCSSCKKVGNSLMHNCLSCRDSSYYSLYRYNSFENEGNCNLKMPNSSIGLLHSHDYSSAEKKGIDEDSSGLDCDVCLFNGTCTDNYPFYVVKKRNVLKFVVLMKLWIKLAF